MSIALLAAAALGGCSSRNPDALTAANLDENLAAMDSNDMVNAEGNAESVNADGNAGASADSDGRAVETTAADNRNQANVDAAVETLNEVAAEENDYCNAELQAAGEAEDCED